MIDKCIMLAFESTSDMTLTAHCGRNSRCVNQMDVKMNRLCISAREVTSVTVAITTYSKPLTRRDEEGVVEFWLYFRIKPVLCFKKNFF